MKSSYHNRKKGSDRGMRKLIIDGNAVYELDEKCMLIREVSDAAKEKTELQSERSMEKDRKKN